MNFRLRGAQRDVCSVLVFFGCLCVPVLVSGTQHGQATKDQKSVVLLAAGDIADCTNLSGAEATAKILEANDGTVVAIGDLAYPDGTRENFQCYDKTWGRVKNRTRPSPGNHEFHSQGATFYFEYFGDAAGDPKNGIYSSDLGPSHIMSLNSAWSESGGGQQGRGEEKWLREELT